MILWVLEMLWSFPLVQGYYSLIGAKIIFQNCRFYPYSAAPVVKSCHRWRKVRNLSSDPLTWRLCIFGQPTRPHLLDILCVAWNHWPREGFFLNESIAIILISVYFYPLKIQKMGHSGLALPHRNDWLHVRGVAPFRWGLRSPIWPSPHYPSLRPNAMNTHKVRLRGKIA